jgi:predicted RNase H-like nuclease
LSSVLGVDWYRSGWVATRLDDGSSPSVAIAANLPELLALAGDAACIAIDMPIGLPRKVREADLHARAFVGPRRSSVFPAPPREVLYADTYERANEIAVRVLDGKKISKQSYALGVNVKLVEDVAHTDERVVEVHPEVSFRALAGEPLAWAKTTWNGQLQRRRLLEERAGIALPDDLGPAGVVPVADVLDSAAAAWSARRYATGEAESCPPGARRGEHGVIWY